MKIISKTIEKYKLHIDKELKIFYVEDELYYSKLISANLNKMGFMNVHGFSSGEELLIQIENKNIPDCIILDYVIKDGIDAYEILTELNRYRLDFAIIILSGQSEVEKATKIIRNGASDYIVKNNMTYFNLENALNKINKAMILKIHNEIKARRSRLVYIILIGIVWLFGVTVMFFKFKNGTF